MRHCCSFDALDIWYLKNNENFCRRTLYIGFCPLCKKPVIELIQQNKHTHTYSFLKKVGPKANMLTTELLPEKEYARSEVHKDKVVNLPFGWKYGINKEYKSGSNGSVIKQFASDFYGNKALIKKVT